MEMHKVNNQRIQVRAKNPNELFQNWLVEWIAEAERKNLKSKYNLHLALDSLKKFPLPLQTGKECAILKGFGPILCNLIDQKLEELNEKKSLNTTVQYDEDILEISKTVLTNEKKSKKYQNHKEIKSLKPRTQSKTNLNIARSDSEPQYILTPRNFNIILIIDTQETNGKLKKNLDDSRLFFDKLNIKYDVRRLSVGDFLWICQDKLDENKELCLPYIVERKRMDDFASSIRDGRFNEQKFRLRDCGLENLIYLIENYGTNQHIGLPLPNLMQAATNTQIHNNFQIKFTDSLKDSMHYISLVTKFLIQKFKDKTLLSTELKNLQELNLNFDEIGLIKFKNFQINSLKTKNTTIREIFIKQLLQLHSLSVDKAVAITECYSTPKALILAYNECDTVEEAENLLKSIPCGKLGRQLGSNISKIIYRFYNQHEF